MKINGRHSGKPVIIPASAKTESSSEKRYRKVKYQTKETSQAAYTADRDVSFFFTAEVSLSLGRPFRKIFFVSTVKN